MQWTVLAALCMVGACSSIPYSDDTGFLVSAQAESPEVPVMVDGKLCKDMDGIMGQCAKRVTSADILQLHMDPMPYSYTLKLACTSQLGVSASVPVAQSTAWDLQITPAQVGNLVLYICRGEVVPDDRPEPITAFWQIMVEVVDKNYNVREQAYFQQDGDDTYLILGQHAKYARVYDAGSWKELSKTTMVKLDGPQSQVKAYSESYESRWNEIGY